MLMVARGASRIVAGMTFPPRLIDGYRAFTATRLPLERSRFQKLAETGQHPEVMVICCCDSRVSPEVAQTQAEVTLLLVCVIVTLVMLVLLFADQSFSKATIELMGRLAP
jgi:hypothetical protein